MKRGTRTPIVRMSRIRVKLLRGENFNASTLAREFDVTPKTIHRDIDFLRDFLGYEITFDGTRRSFIGRPSLITTL